MDSSRAILNEIFPLLTDDSTLLGLMGGTVPLYYQWAPPNTTMPYLVHNIQEAPESLVIGTANYYLDGWDFASTADRLFDIRARIRAILEHALLTTGAARLALQAIENPPVDTAEVWHFSSVWAVRFTRTADMNAVREREE